ncbi:MAG TPA: carboxypeptidase regulatory-like domain-containing protein [Acidobacteriaceae bacterium]
MMGSTLRRWGKSSRSAICVLAILAISGVAMASENHGQVTFNGSPVPGATITATQGSKKFVAISGEDGSYAFPDLPDGAWKLKISMTDFAPIEQVVTVSPNTPSIKWELTLLPLAQILAQAKAVKAGAATSVTASVPEEPGKGEAPKAAEAAAPPKPSDETSQLSADGFLVNGSVNNAATSQFSLSQAFGNTRKGGRGLYNGGFGLILDNSALDAKPFSLSGLNSPKAAYNRVTGIVSFGGPINIPHLLPRGPNFFVGYRWSRDSNAAIDTGHVPTASERSGDLSGGLLGGTIVPVDPVAQNLLKLYPLPNVPGNTEYNYQIPVLNNSHQDALQTRLEKTVSRRDEINGGFEFESIRANSKNLFGFVDTTDTLGIDSKVNWNHRIRGMYIDTGYQFSRMRTMVVPYFANRTNVSLEDGVTGNDQDPSNWGPPSLDFANVVSLSDGNSSFDRNRTDGVSLSVADYHGRHNFTFGGDFRRQEFNYKSQENPRGTFTFTSAATGISDLADFLEGIPDTSRIAYGNADKYFRQSVYDVFANDDWRIRPELTINAGIRWEYGAPMTELFGRLVNLDVAPGFTAVAPVLGSDPKGSLTGGHYPSSLIRPDRLGIEPRIGISWRPIPGSSVVVRAGYGVYDDTSVYESMALQMAQQEPLSTSLSVQTSAVCPETLASGFNPCASVTPDTFAVDPNFRVGYAQTWQVSIQRDLPGSLQMTASYLGIKGTRGVQEYLPNTYPIGATDPCPLCPSGFEYQASNGDSTREAGSIQLRRRLRSGFTANLQYTFSKAIDDDSALGGQGPVATGAGASAAVTTTVAQNWLDLRAERGLSSFDQRHLLKAEVQYTTGMGLSGGTLLGGWRGRALKEWTAVGTITAGSGLPQTPIYLAAVNGSGVTGPIRPDRTGAPIYAGSAGHFLNLAAFAPPQSGQWGDAGRNSIIGPGQFSFNASLARTFRLRKRYNLDLRIDSTNLLNHVVYSGWDTTLNPIQNPGSPFTTGLEPLFGLPINANSMRSLQVTARLRF